MKSVKEAYEIYLQLFPFGIMTKGEKLFLHSFILLFLVFWGYWMIYLPANLMQLGSRAFYYIRGPDVNTSF